MPPQIRPLHPGDEDTFCFIEPEALGPKRKRASAATTAAASDGVTERMVFARKLPIVPPHPTGHGRTTSQDRLSPTRRVEISGRPTLHPFDRVRVPPRKDDPDAELCHLRRLRGGRETDRGVDDRVAGGASDLPGLTPCLGRTCHGPAGALVAYRRYERDGARASDIRGNPANASAAVTHEVGVEGDRPHETAD